MFSPRKRPGERSGIVVFEPPPPEQGRGNAKQLQKIAADLESRGIVIVVREGRLRASPHIYNTAEQVERLVGALP